MNKKIIALIVLGIVMVATTYLTYNSLSQLDEFNFEEDFGFGEFENDI